MANNYDVNYNDERFAEVETDKKAALTELEQTYGGMINSSDKYYQDQINASKQWADKQSQLQQEQTDFAISEIEQQKAQAKKDYTKEQSGAYVDWQKQSNQYGAEAEKQAASGLANSGFSESSQVSMYNTYQNRVATARESYNLAVQNYNNAITEARLQNNSILAEIAYEALQTQLQLSLEGFQYKNSLILDKANKKTELNNEYYSRYQDVLQQINTENALAEEVRQYNETLALEKAQLEEEKRQFNAQLAEEQRQFNAAQAAAKSSSSGRSSSSSKSSKSSKSSSKSGNKVNKTSSGSSDNAKTLESIIDLGYGPISGQTLDKLVASGAVKETTLGNTTVFTKNENTSSGLDINYDRNKNYGGSKGSSTSSSEKSSTQNTTANSKAVNGRSRNGSTATSTNPRLKYQYGKG